MANCIMQCQECIEMHWYIYFVKPDGHYYSVCEPLLPEIDPHPCYTFHTILISDGAPTDLHLDGYLDGFHPNISYQNLPVKNLSKL